MCKMSTRSQFIVPASRFKLTKGKEKLTTYRFNTGIAKHTFCSVCGVKSFYVPRSNPDGYSIVTECLDKATIADVIVKQFDGEHWEESMAANPLIRDLSNDKDM